MTGLDSLVASSMKKEIERELGKKTKNLLEDRLFYRYGIGFEQAMRSFDKLDIVLREFFGSGADGFEQKTLGKICNVHMSKTKEKNLVRLYDKNLTRVILEAFNDGDKKAILQCSMKKPLSLLEILKITKIPITLCDHKIESLIESGLLYETMRFSSPKGKMVSKYKTLFDGINLTIENDEVSVGLQLDNESLMRSSIVRAVYAL